MLSAWTWPQIIMVVWLVLRAVVMLAIDGDAVKVNGYSVTLNCVLIALVLYWGGFWQ